MAARRRRIAAAGPVSEKALFEELEHQPDEQVLRRMHAWAGHELERGRHDRGLYYQSLAQAGGDEGKTRAAYVSNRVDGLLADFETWCEARAESEGPPSGANGFDLFMIAIVILVVLAFVVS